MAARSAPRAARSSGVVPMSRIASAPRSMRRLRYGGNSFSCAFGFAPAASRMSIIARLVVSSSDGRSGRPPCGSVLKSTARYSGVRPQKSHLLTFAPASSKYFAVSKCAFSSARSSGVTPSGSVRSTAAPAPTSAFAHSRQPWRAAYKQRRETARHQVLLARLRRDHALPLVDRGARVDLGAMLEQQLRPSADGSAPRPTSAPSGLCAPRAR